MSFADELRSALLNEIPADWKSFRPYKFSRQEFETLWASSGQLPHGCLPFELFYPSGWSIRLDPLDKADGRIRRILVPSESHEVEVSEGNDGVVSPAFKLVAASIPTIDGVLDSWDAPDFGKGFQDYRLRESERITLNGIKMIAREFDFTRPSGRWRSLATLRVGSGFFCLLDVSGLTEDLESFRLRLVPIVANLRIYSDVSSFVEALDQAELRAASRKAGEREAETHFSRAGILYEKRDLNGAVAEYSEALRVKPDFPEAHNNLGMVLAAKGDYDGAISEYREALRFNPDHPNAHNNLGNTLMCKGDRAAAIREYRKVIRIKPDHASAHNNLGNALNQEGNLEGAIVEFREAARLNQNHPDAHFNLGLMLERKGDRDAAIREYREALRVTPDHQQAQYMRRAIEDWDHPESPLTLTELIAKLNDTTRAALEEAAGLCLARTHYEIEIEHFLLRLLGSTSATTDVAKIFPRFGINSSGLHQDLERGLGGLRTGNTRTPPFSRSLVRMLSEGWKLGSLEFGSSRIRSGHALAALVSDPDLSSRAREISAELAKIPPSVVRKDFVSLTAGSKEDAATRS